MTRVTFFHNPTVHYIPRATKSVVNETFYSGDEITRFREAAVRELTFLDTNEAESTLTPDPQQPRQRERRETRERPNKIQDTCTRQGRPDVNGRRRVERARGIVLTPAMEVHAFGSSFLEWDKENSLSSHASQDLERRPVLEYALLNDRTTPPLIIGRNVV